MLRCLDLGLSLSDLDLLTIGMVYDMITEKSNDDCDYDEIGTQEDMKLYWREVSETDRVKGLMIEIGGNVTGLKKALADVDKSLKNTQTSLKDVNRLLKLDPKNTELLAQKQELLKKAIGETKDRLAALKQAEAQVQQQFREGKVSEEQYNNLKREIVDTESKLKSLDMMFLF